SGRRAVEASEMTISWTVAAVFLLLAIVPQHPVTPFFIVRRLSSDSPSYHDNPAISPLNLMNMNAALMRLTSRRTPDLPESFSPSAKRFSFTDSTVDAVSGRYPTFY
uniref:Secreted protein n=1 Tax=Haemonchus contortus TaxID=6289 RepID=A0A7I4Y2P2_HAECO